MKLDREKIYAVFIDIDGTLMGSSEAALRANTDAISKVRTLGNKVFISTGRAPSYFPSCIDFENGFDGVIAGAGAYVRVGNEEIEKKIIPYDTVKKVCDYFIENNISGALEGVKNMFYCAHMTFKEDDWIKFDKSSADEIITPDTPILKFTIDGQVPTELIGILGDNYILMQHPNFGEVIVKNCTKAAGIKAALDYLNIPQSQSIAIGDSRNDLEMINFAGIGVAMGNAVDEIKAAADMVTLDVNSAGVAAALTELFEI